MESPVYYFDASTLAEAHAQARKTFGYFWRELSWERRRIIPAFDAACVKVDFEDAGKVEHMWVTDVDFDGESLTGTLMNEPNELTNIHAGDPVRASFERVGDWMLIGDATALGAFTVQAMRAGMSPAERAQHDAAWELDFGPPESVKLPPSDDDHPMALNMGASLAEFLQANPNEIRAADARGFTMLHREALAGNLVVVRTLLNHGAEVSARTRAGRTALDLARSLGWGAVESVLHSVGAS